MDVTPSAGKAWGLGTTNLGWGEMHNVAQDTAYRTHTTDLWPFRPSEQELVTYLRHVWDLQQENANLLRKGTLWRMPQELLNWHLLSHL